MADLNCEEAFAKEMDALNGIKSALSSLNTGVKSISAKISLLANSQDSGVLKDIHAYLILMQNQIILNQTEIKETNRLLKFLCENLIGRSE